MIRMREWSALLLPIMLAPALQAQNKPTSPWAIDRSLSVSPRRARRWRSSTACYPSIPS